MGRTLPLWLHPAITTAQDILASIWIVGGSGDALSIFIYSLWFTLVAFDISADSLFQR